MSTIQKTNWYSKISYPVLLAGLIFTMLLHAVLTKKVLVSFDWVVPFVNLLFHSLLGVLLWSLFAKRYTPDALRKILMGFFLLEMVLGLFMKDVIFTYHTEITLIGLLGILFTWLNTHANRRNFSQE